MTPIPARPQGALEPIVNRTIVAAAMLGHGLPKLVATNQWPGPVGAGEGFTAQGIRGGTGIAAVAGVTQVAAAILTVAQPRSAAGPALALGSMAVAARAKARNGFWSHEDGAEYPLVLALLAGALAAATPPSPTNRALLTAAAFGGGVAAKYLTTDRMLTPERQDAT